MAGHCQIIYNMETKEEAGTSHSKVSVNENLKYLGLMNCNTGSGYMKCFTFTEMLWAHS